MSSTSARRPLIPENFIDIPSQRLYYLSLGLFLQAAKAFDVLQNFFANDAKHYCRKWLCIDFAYVIFLSQLRIPRLTYGKATVLVQILLLWFGDGLLFGGISLNFERVDLTSTPEPFYWTDMFSPSRLTSLFSDRRDKNQHLLGQHTVHMSPISTAQLNPDGHPFCLSPPGHTTFVPILVNGTAPSSVRYSFTPLTYVDGQPGTGRIEHIEMNAKELKAIAQARLEGLQVVRFTNSDEDEFDEYDAGDDDSLSSESRLRKTESLAHIRVTKPGIVRLDRVLDSSGIAVKLVHPPEVTVVPCPTAQYTGDPLRSTESDTRCAGDNHLDLTIDIRGVPPLSLKWSKDVNGKKETFLVDNIEDSSTAHSSTGDLREVVRRIRTPQKFKVPLSLSVDSLGRITFVLESVIDGLGNVVSLDQGKPSESPHTGVAVDSRTVRSLNVLSRPRVSFRQCGPGNPASLLIGSESSLVLGIDDGDPSDAPWTVHITYDSSENTAGVNQHHSTLSVEADTKELGFGVRAPGEYTISNIKGKYCEGDVLSPDTCKVVQKPLPTAEIEWKRIHECSGDTGVSAALILHGTPPFQVYYRTQRDNESPRDLVKTFTTSRGTITLQPEHSGHYYYTFLQLSDSNYRKIPLDGPSIDQIVHPLAAADFVPVSAGRNKMVLNSCSGNVVDVGVDLRGTPPWNLELQVVGPRSTDSIVIRDISSSPVGVPVPIPSDIDKEGGTFEVDLVTVEDMYGCKRSVSVPGISVNVRRVQPTARFYSKDGRRQVTLLEDESAELPLRLTGDGPWRVKYRRTDTPDLVQAAVLASPNNYLRVKGKGTYELVEVNDLQCPGAVVPGENTYEVDWVPRPSARLDLQMLAVYEPYNRSHILPSICQGHDDYVDLELSGRPPFQIMYNVATNAESGGGTIVLDQLTIGSIQRHTRFQLHTSTPGRTYYEVKQIGDAAYPLHKDGRTLIPRSERLLFEQEILRKPSAKFKTDNRLSYCLNDVLGPKDPASPDGTILLDGTPPFQLKLSIKNLAANKVRVENIEVNDRTWRLNLPSYYFTSVGPYQVTIDSVHDSSRCEQAMVDPLHRSIWIDVAETAAIIPLEKKKDFCVGDIIQFELEGTPPWTIGYRINGKSYTRDAKASPFSILQQQSGDFTISSIAHQHKMCKAAITNLQMTIHPLPSALVGHGRRIYQDIHEGDQAEIVFTLIGEPPFTFTYQRSEPSPKKGGKPGKVLETHTVSGVTAHEYSITSAVEGTWTVTSISDRYCRYPALQAE
ncbi:hypothetical protein PISMIDRAFT_26692 [Pisolithus microcarpus 441]|uniref:Nucleoporin POM152 n=1 Tax=Pisolithus microcarpus 441 TaxID=765257 RepID=A0A0C9ZLB2_9AGAM|nr:hypothetical protein PISMIDRAFT_26692 [Pisolithus microcarpus 441]